MRLSDKCVVDQGHGRRHGGIFIHDTDIFADAVDQGRCKNFLADA